MSNLKKLEASHSPKWHLWIKVGAEESDDEAIRRTAAEMGIRPEDIGFVDLWYTRHSRMQVVSPASTPSFPIVRESVLLTHRNV